MLKFVAFAISLARGFFDVLVLLRMWQWFVEPLGAPHLRYWQVYALELMVSFMLFTSSAAKPNWKSDEIDGETQVLRAIAYWIVCSMIFGIAWLLHATGAA